MKVAITKQFQDFILGTGVSLGEILESAGIPNLLWREELDLSPADYGKLMFALDERLTDGQILAFSDVRQINAFLPPVFAALCAKNGLDALGRFALYKRLVCPLQVTVVETEHAVDISLKYDLPVSTMPRFALLNEQLVLLNLLRTGTGKELCPLRVCAPYPYGEALRAFLGAAPEIGAENRISFARSDMQRPFLTQNNVMWSYLEPELNRRLAALAGTQSFTSQVEKTLYSAIPGARYSREEIARSLGVSVRTMQRKLSDDHTTYAQLVQKVQKLLAMSYIRIDELSLEEISCLVGYREQTSFSRAFKAWTGQTFTEYRMANCGKR